MKNDTTSPQLPYLVYLWYSEYMVQLVSQLVAITFLGRLLFTAIVGGACPPSSSSRKALAATRLSVNFRAYLAASTVGISLSVFYTIYLVTAWRPYQVSPLYNVTILYWTGMWAYLYVVLSPMITFFLTLERCLALNLSLSSATLHRCVVAEIGAFVFSYIANVLYLIAFQAPDYEKSVMCRTFLCLLNADYEYPQLAFRLGFALANLFTSFYFLYAVRKFRKKHSINDTVVKVAVTTDIFCTIVPSYVIFLMQKVLNINPNPFVGPISGMLCYAEAAVLSVIYMIKLNNRRLNARIRSKESIFVKRVQTTTTNVSAVVRSSEGEATPSVYTGLGSNRFTFTPS